MIRTKHVAIETVIPPAFGIANSIDLAFHPPELLGVYDPLRSLYRAYESLPAHHIDRPVRQRHKLR
jgi:hypothetical protein